MQKTVNESPGVPIVNKQDIEKYLRMLGQELQQRNITGEILLAGGAVMLLKVQNREVTKDIDAYFNPGQANVIREAARIIADREGLPHDWINDGVKGFFYAQPPTERWAEYPGLRIYIPSLDYLRLPFCHESCRWSSPRYRRYQSISS
jgi:hypothetical protein